LTSRELVEKRESLHRAQDMLQQAKHALVSALALQTRTESEVQTRIAAAQRLEAEVKVICLCVFV
jgi:hypothetical protein